MIKAVFIDIDNTLLDFIRGSRVAVKNTMDEYGFEFSDEVYNVFKEVNDELWRGIEKHIVTQEELYKTRWNMILERFGIEADGEAVDRRFRELVQETAVPVDNACEMLRYLSSKYPVYAASNAFHNKQGLRLEKAGMRGFIKRIMTSGELGYLKPSREFFDECMKIAGLENPAEVVIIGDSLTADISGGIEYGFKTCWFNFHNEELPDDIKPDFVVTSLDEVKLYL